MLDPGAIGSTTPTLKVSVTRRPAHQFAAAARVERRASRRRRSKLRASSTRRPACPATCTSCALRNADATQASRKRCAACWAKAAAATIRRATQRRMPSTQTRQPGARPIRRARRALPPLPSGGLAAVPPRRQQRRCRAAGRPTAARASRRTRTAITGDDQPGRHDPGRPRDQLADHHRARPGVPQSAHGDRPARRAPRAGLYRGADRRTVGDDERRISASSGRALLLSNGGNNAVYGSSSFGSGNTNIVDLTLAGNAVAQNPSALAATDADCSRRA